MNKFYYKYIKYKIKYLNLIKGGKKNDITGGMSNIKIKCSLENGKWECELKQKRTLKIITHNIGGQIKEINNDPKDFVNKQRGHFFRISKTNKITEQLENIHTTKKHKKLKIYESINHPILYVFKNMLQEKMNTILVNKKTVKKLIKIQII